MPTIQTLGKLRGVAIGIKSASETLMNISLKKRQLAKEDEEDKVDSKIKTLQLQKLESQMDPELFKMQNQELKDEMKAKKAYRDYTLSFLNRQDKATRDEVTKMDSFGKGVIDTAQDYNTPGVELGGMEFDLTRGLKGDFPFKKGSASGVWGKSGLSDVARNKIVGELKKGSYKEGTESLPHDKQTAKDLLLDSGYLNFEEDKTVVDLINKLPEVKDTTYRLPGKKEKLIEPRAEGLARIGKGAKYGDAVDTYGKETTDQVISVIQEYQKEGKSFDEISTLMEEQNIDPELFLKFYR